MLVRDSFDHFKVERLTPVLHFDAVQILNAPGHGQAEIALAADNHVHSGAAAPKGARDRIGPPCCFNDSFKPLACCFDHVLLFRPFIGQSQC
jgi:hypothetical protein